MIKVKIQNPTKGRNEPTFRPLFFIKEQLKNHYSIEITESDDFDYLIEELYPDGLSETALNDLLWFDDAFIFEALGIREEE